MGNNEQLQAIVTKEEKEMLLYGLEKKEQTNDHKKGPLKKLFLFWK